MGSVNIDDIKKKTSPEDLSTDDIETLKENWDSLDDSEKEVFKDYAPTPPEKDDNNDDKDKEPPAPPSLTAEDVKKTFHEEIDKYMQERNPDKPVTEDEKRWFGKDFNPKDWDDFADKFYEKAVQRMQKEAQEARDKQNEQIKKANDKITADINALKASGEDIPAEGTKEREDFDRDFTKFAVDYGVVASVPKAYELYKKVKETAKNKEIDKQKDTLSKVSRGGGNPSGGNNNEKDYNESVRDRSMDDIIADAAQRFNELK